MIVGFWPVGQFFAQGCTGVHRVAVFWVYMAVFVGFKAYGFLVVLACLGSV